MTDRSLKFPGLSEIRTEWPVFQADSVTGQLPLGIMSPTAAVPACGIVAAKQRKVLVP